MQVGCAKLNKLSARGAAAVPCKLNNAKTNKHLEQ